MLVFRREELLKRRDDVDLDEMEGGLKNAAKEAGLSFEVETEVELARSALQHAEGKILILVILTPTTSVAKTLSQVDRKVFGIVLNPLLASSPKERLDTYMQGIKMITSEVNAVRTVTLDISARGESSRRRYECPKCHVTDLDENELRKHYFSYHCTEKPMRAPCPICSYRPGKREVGIAVHLHNAHGPVAEREPRLAQFAAFSWIICVHPDTKKILLINEPAPICDGFIPKYWFPAGRVDPGESFSEAAVREAMEEGGVKVVLKKVLMFILDDCPRVMFLAHPEDLDAVPKSIPDFESVGALWSTVSGYSQLDDSDFRSRETKRILDAVALDRLVGEDLDTPQFKALERITKKVTKKFSAKREKEFIEAWNALRDVYQESTFDESRRNSVVFGTPPPFLREDSDL